jgi:hypothetical protein
MRLLMAIVHHLNNTNYEGSKKSLKAEQKATIGKIVS